MQPDLSIAGRRPRVLVTGIGGPAAQGFIAAFPEESVEWFVVDADPLAPAYNLFPPNRRAIVPLGGAAGFVEALMSHAIRSSVDVVVPTVDAELSPLVAARDQFAAAGISVLAARKRTLELTLDKWELAQALRGVVPVPATALMQGSVDQAAPSWPVIAKPRSGSGSRGIVFAQRPADLEAVPRKGSYLLQEYLPGAEYSIDVLAGADGTVVAAVPRERLRVDSGIAVTARTVRDPELIAFGTAVAQAIGLTGVANVQCKRDRHGRAALLEVNPRFPGTMALTVAAGVNMPQLSLADALGHPIPRSVDFHDTAIVRTLQDHVIDPTSLASGIAVAPERGAA